MSIPSHPKDFILSSEVEYHAPYLWSVLDVLRGSLVYVGCDPVGGGYV
ncbi:MAG TPA: hypothetical protein PLM96_10315 [Methanoregulaceae archaeon]|nr:hypothetical protein [Methanolinea sp.]MDD3092114.1 hypothetical protein [Methanoregulaceae archaeon]MDD5048869.1 hypothetical protein [Methanoregulaceae archaeon]MDD5685911.1 hypothetical protein [Methanoregulaceae archaeon]HPQ77023.1 hypothetical protein [Methanoregulaceae archaeon]